MAPFLNLFDDFGTEGFQVARIAGRDDALVDDHFGVFPFCACTSLKTPLLSRGIAMSDELDWNFVDKDDARAEIRAAVEYLLKDAAGGARSDIVQEIVRIVRQVANGLPAGQPDSPGR